MDFRELVERRRSVRHFRGDPVTPEHLREIVRIAGLAPSPNNAQPWRFVVVTRRALLVDMSDAVRRRLHALIPQPSGDDGRLALARVEWSSTFFAEAPAVVAVALGPYRAVIADALAGTGLTHDEINEMRLRPDLQSIGAAIEHLLLAAADLGYGGCWMSGPLIAREDLERLLDIRAPWRIAALVALGRPAPGAERPRERKPLEEIFETRS